MDYIQKFLSFLTQENPSLSAVTLKNYRADTNKFIQWIAARFGTFTPSTLTPAIIQEFEAACLQKGTAASWTRYKSSLKLFFEYLVKTKELDSNPFSALYTQVPEQDPFNLRAFKNELFAEHSSHLTVKNYSIDIKQFLTWAETVTGQDGALLLPLLTMDLLNEYKNRLAEDHTFSPASINRKLSSARKYLSWVGVASSVPAPVPVIALPHTPQTVSRDDILSSLPEHTLIPEGKKLAVKTVKKYSSFPPLRLIQRISNLFSGVIDACLVSPAVHVSHVVRRRSRKATVFLSRKVTQHITKVKNLPKDLYSPLITYDPRAPWYKKLIYHVIYTRPNWFKRYQKTAVSQYFNLLVVLVFAAIVGVGIYINFIQKANPSLAAQISPLRVLSFQGRLTDTNDNPTTSTKWVRFIIYSDPSSSASARLWEEDRQVTPDSDGIFSVLLGGNGSGGAAALCNGNSAPASPATGACGIMQPLFAQNQQLYLGVTIENTPELTPRQQLATVSYATNAEMLQGLPPTTDTTNAPANSNAVLALNGSGVVSISGSASPTTIQYTGNQFNLIGNVLSLQTASTTNSNIQLIPDGIGKIDIQKSITNTTRNGNAKSAATSTYTDQGAVEVQDMFAVIATSSGQSAFTLDQESTGPLISASTSGTAKFTVDSSGNLTTAGNLVLSSNTATTTFGGFPYLWPTSGQSNGYVLTTNGSSSLSWTAAAGNYWQRNLGALSPLNITDDLLLGSSATTGASLRFGFINVVGAGTPTATISGNFSLKVPTTTTTPASTINLLNGGTLGVYQSIGGDAGLSANPSLFISNAGKVGLGTTTPFDQLANTGSNILDSLSTGTTIGSSIAWSANAAGYAQALYNSSAASNANGLLVKIDGTAATNKAFSVDTGASQASAGTNLFTIQGNGSVGVGTTSPTALLDVAGAASVSGTLSFRNGSALIQATQSNPLTIGSTSTGPINIGTDATARVLTVGNTTSNSSTTLTAGTGNINFYSTSNNITPSGNLTLAGSTPLTFTGTTPLAIAQTNGSTLNFTDGTNNLVQLIDAGTTGNLNVTGIYQDAGVSGVTIASAGCVTTTGGIVTGSGACGSSFNWWASAPPNGALTPINSTLDLLFGGNATTSAKFAFLNDNSAINTDPYPVASFSATNKTAQTGLVLTTDGSIQSLIRGPLTLGGSTTGNINVGSDANARLVTIGNTTGATGISELVGTGNFSLDGVAGSTYAVGPSTVGGAIAVGGTGTTGTISLGIATSGTNIVAIGNGATTGTQTISIGTAATGTGIEGITIGKDINTSSLTLDAGTGNISIGAGTTSVAKTITIGSSAETGNITIGQYTGTGTSNILMGHATVGNGGIENINIGDAATGTGKDVITIGNTNAASGLTFNSGTAGIASTATSTTTNAFAFTDTAATSGNVINVTAPNPKVNANAGVLTSGNLINVASANDTYMTLSNKDLTIGNHININTTITNIVRVFVYDTSKDSDGGNWTSDDRAQASSWYNEAVAHTADACVINTDTRCGAQAFPKKAILVATTTTLFIFDAKDNSLWMAFNKNASGFMIGIVTNSTGSSVFGLNGRVYYSTNGSAAEGLFAIDFKRDQAFRYNATNLSYSIQNIKGRNAAITWNPVSTSPALLSATVNSVHAAIVKGNTYVAVAENGATNGDIDLINESNYTNVGHFGAASKAYQAVWYSPDDSLYGLNSTDSKLDVFYKASTLSGNNVAASTNYSTSTTPALYSVAPTINTGLPDSLYVTTGTSDIDGHSNTVYVAHNAGMSVIQEAQGNETAGSAKYYNNSDISEEMIGDIRTMLPLAASGTLTTNTTLAAPDADVSVKGVAFTTKTATTTHTAGLGVRGLGLTFNGSTDYLCTGTTGTCASNSNIDFANNNMSVSMWLKVATASKFILDKRSGAAGAGYNMQTSATGKLVTTVTDGTNSITGTSATTITDNNWHHIVFTLSRPTNGSACAASTNVCTLTQYIDGVADGSGTSTTLGSMTNAGALYLMANSSAANQLAGTLDEFTVSGSVYTLSEINHMYQVGYRALQNQSHAGTETFRGVTVSQDAANKFNGATARVNAISASTDNGMIYIATNGSGVSIIGQATDTLSDLYSSSITSKDNINVAWPAGLDTTTTLSVSKGYGTGVLVGFGATGNMWFESQNTSFKDFLASSSNPFGTNLTQSNLNINQTLQVTNPLSTELDNSALNGVANNAIATAFRVDSSGNFLDRSLTNSTTAMQFQNAAGSTVLNVDTTNGFLGIGTSTPLTSLQVVGTASLSANLSFYGQGTAHTVPILNNGSLNFETSVGGDAVLNSALYISAGTATTPGNIGIGTTTTPSVLNVNGTNIGKPLVTLNETGTNDIISASVSGVLKARLDSSAFWYTSKFIDIDNASNQYYIDPATTGSSASLAGSLTFSGVAAHNINYLDNSNIAFQRSVAGDAGLLTSTPTLYLQNTGNVGIGTTTPGNRLDVEGGAVSVNTTTASDGVTINGIPGTGFGQLRMVDGNYGVFLRNDGSTTYLLHTASGSQYGTWNNDRQIQFPDGSDNVYLSASGGSVGIGTTSPQAPLDVRSATANILALSGTNVSATRSIVVDTSGADINTNIGGAINFIDDGAFGANITFSEHTGSAGTAQTERMRINSNGNVGIGTTNPQHLFNVQQDLTHSNTGGTGQIGITGNSNTNKRLEMGYDTTSNYGWLEAVTVATGWNNLALQPSGGNVGIGMTNPTHLFQLNADDAAKPTSNTWTIVSDERLKENIQPFDSGLSDLLNLNPVSYELNGKANLPKGAKGIGILAQDALPYIPYTISTFSAMLNPGDTEPTTLYQFNSSALTFTLINAVKQLNYNIAAVATESGILAANLNLTDTGDLTIVSNPSSPASSYDIHRPDNTIITQMGTLAKAVIGNLRVGGVDAQDVVTHTLAVTTSNLTISGQNINDYITKIVDTEIGNWKLEIGNSSHSEVISPLADIDQIHTNVISPLATDTIHIDGSVVIASDSAAISPDKVLLDVQGSASIAGTLNSQNLTINSDATISGTLHAGKIVADEIQGLDAKLSTLSAQNITNVNNIYFATPSSSLATSYEQPTTNPSSPSASPFALSPMPYADVASYSAFLAYVPSLSASTAFFTQNLSSSGTTTLADTSIAGQLSVEGTLVLADNSINVLGATLEVQSLRQGNIAFEGGLIAMDTNGDLDIAGDATIHGRLATSLISPLAGQDLSVILSGNEGSSPDSSHSAQNDNQQFLIKNSSASAVLAVNTNGDVTASGSGTFNKLNLSLIQPAFAVSDTEVVATGSAGTTQILANHHEITIDDPAVTDKSLIYITPVGQPVGGTVIQTPYLVRQVSGTSFTVGVGGLSPQPVQFNWLIVN